MFLLLKSFTWIKAERFLVFRTNKDTFTNSHLFHWNPLKSHFSSTDSSSSLVYFSSDRTRGHGGLWPHLHRALQPLPLSRRLLIGSALGGRACLSRLPGCWLAKPATHYSAQQSPVHRPQVLPLGARRRHLRWGGDVITGRGLTWGVVVSLVVMLLLQREIKY